MFIQGYEEFLLFHDLPLHWPVWLPYSHTIANISSTQIPMDAFRRTPIEGPCHAGHRGTNRVVQRNSRDPIYAQLRSAAAGRTRSRLETLRSEHRGMQPERTKLLQQSHPT